MLIRCAGSVTLPLRSVTSGSLLPSHPRKIGPSQLRLQQTDQFAHSLEQEKIPPLRMASTQDWETKIVCG